MLLLSVIGNIGNDAIIRETNKKKVIVFSIAHNFTWKDEKDNKHEKTTWINCSMWRDGNVNIAEYLKKGAKVFVQGTPDVTVYTNDKQEHIASLNLTVKNVELLLYKKDEE